MTIDQGRRRFLLQSAAATAGIAIAPGATMRRALGPEFGPKLRIGVIGVANRAAANLQAVAGEEIVALCDVDARYLAGAVKKFPRARPFADYRELLELDGLDAVVISTPDHHHAPAAERALVRGLDVYCEKPLSHTVGEARRLASLAIEHGAVTQLGTQIHANDNYRRVVELVQSGAIGEVGAVHVFCATRAWGGGTRPAGELEVPSTLDWDLWLGPAPERPYHDGYHPAHWRRFWDFGGGNLADMGCHYLDLAFWALALDAPRRVRADAGSVDAEVAPQDIVVRYEFPSGRAGDSDDLAVTWYGGKARPPMLAELGLDGWSSAVLFLGTDGRFLISDYSRHRLGPAAAVADHEPPPRTIPDSIGHHAEWLQACRARGTTTCPFTYGGPLTEAVLLGNVSYRLGGRSLEWDAVAGRVVDDAEAIGLLDHERRQGW